MNRAPQHSQAPDSASWQALFSSQSGKRVSSMHVDPSILLYLCM